MICFKMYMCLRFVESGMYLGQTGVRVLIYLTTELECLNCGPGFLNMKRGIHNLFICAPAGNERQLLCKTITNGKRMSKQENICVPTTTYRW